MLQTSNYSLVLFLQFLLLFYDLFVNSFSELLRTAPAVQLVLFIIQDIAILFNVIIIFLMFFNTFVFQAGLVNLLFHKFKGTILLSAAYLALSISFHVWVMRPCSTATSTRGRRCTWATPSSTRTRSGCARSLRSSAADGTAPACGPSAAPHPEGRIQEAGGAWPGPSAPAQLCSSAFQCPGLLLALARLTRTAGSGRMLAVRPGPPLRHSPWWDLGVFVSSKGINWLRFPESVCAALASPALPFLPRPASLPVPGTEGRAGSSRSPGLLGESQRGLVPAGGPVWGPAGSAGGSDRRTDRGGRGQTGAGPRGSPAPGGRGTRTRDPWPQSSGAIERAARAAGALPAGCHGDARWRPGAASAPRRRCRCCSSSTGGTARPTSWRRPSSSPTRRCCCPTPSATCCWTRCCCSSTWAPRPPASSSAPRATCASGRCRSPSAWPSPCRRP
uniref:Transmembrane protein 138 n=4 Tax=Neognathae TaxID=8825 RepID=A0A8B9CW84_9AVES